MSDQLWSATTGPVDAPHLVLVHGSLDRSAGLLRLSRRLDDAFRVTRYDRRGYGRSRPHTGPFGLADQVDDLEQVVAAAPAPDAPVIVVGHSFGGNVALAFAERHPDRVAGVASYEAPLSWEPWWPDAATGSRALAGAMPPEDAAERFMRSLIGDARWDRLPPSAREARRREGPAMVGELIDLRARPAWRGAGIAARVLSMHGARGREHHRRAAEEIADRIDGAVCVEVAGAGHFGPNTHADAVARLVMEFANGRCKDDEVPR